MVEALKAEKFNWPIWICMIFVISLLVNLAQGPIGVGGVYALCLYGLGTINFTWSLPIMMVMLPMLVYPLRLMNKKINKDTLCRLSIVGLVISTSMNFWTGAGWNSYPWGFAQRVYFSGAAVQELFAGLWWLPPTSAVINMRTGGMPVEWAAWTGSMLW